VAATWEGSSVTGVRVVVNEDGGIFSLFESVSEAMTRLVGFENTLGILQILFGFPGVFCGRIALLFYKKGPSPSLSSMGKYGFYFVFWLSFDKVRWWFEEVFSINSISLVQRK